MTINVAERATLGRVAVIGGGIVGLTIALRVLQAGCQVTLIEERTKCGQGATRAAIGGITPASDDYVRAALGPFYRQTLRAFWNLFADVSSRGRTLHVVDAGVLMCAPTPEEKAWLLDELMVNLPADCQRRWIDGDELKTREPLLSSSLLGALHLMDEPALDPRLLSSAIFEILSESENFIALLATRATHVGADGTVEVQPGTADEPSTLMFDRVVISTGAANDLLPPEWDRPLRPVKGQALLFKTDGPVPRHHVYAHLPAISTEYSASTYVVPRGNGLVAMGVTYEEGPTVEGVTAYALELLSGGMQRLMPASSAWELVEAWAGIRPASRDNLPLVGPIGEGVVSVAVGHFGLGVTLAPLTALLICEHLGIANLDLLENPEFAAFLPTRFELKY